MNVLRAASLAVVAMTALLVAPTASQAAGPSPTASQAFDPSPYCRPSLGTPTGTAKYVGSNQYTVTVKVSVTMTCNRSIYAGSANTILYYVRDNGDSKTVSGSSCSSKGKAGCTATAQVVLTAPCDDYVFVQAHGRLTGSWQQTSSSAKNTISSDNGPTLDDYWTGDDVCA